MSPVDFATDELRQWPTFARSRHKSTFLVVWMIFIDGRDVIQRERLPEHSEAGMVDKTFLPRRVARQALAPDAGPAPIEVLQLRQSQIVIPTVLSDDSYRARNRLRTPIRYLLS